MVENFVLPKNNGFTVLSNLEATNELSNSTRVPLNELVAVAYVNGGSASYSRCVYCHKSNSGGVCSHCKYI